MRERKTGDRVKEQVGTLPRWWALSRGWAVEKHYDQGRWVGSCSREERASTHGVPVPMTSPIAGRPRCGRLPTRTLGLVRWEALVMKRFALVFCALAALASPALALDTPAPTTPTAPGAASLGKPYVVTLGDMIAFTMTQHMGPVRAMDSNIGSQMTFAYDHTSRKIVVYVYGDPHSSNVFGDSRSGVSVDQAKGSLEYFRSKVFPVLTTIVTKTYNVTLADSDLTLIYLDRTANMKEVLRREGDKYLVAEN